MPGDLFRFLDLFVCLAGPAELPLALSSFFVVRLLTLWALFLLPRLASTQSRDMYAGPVPCAVPSRLC